MLFGCHSKILHKHRFQYLMGVKMAPRETEDNAYANFWGDKQRALWYAIFWSGQLLGISPGADVHRFPPFYGNGSDSS